MVDFLKELNQELQVIQLQLDLAQVEDLYAMLSVIVVLCCRMASSSKLFYMMTVLNYKAFFSIFYSPCVDISLSHDLCVHAFGIVHFE